ncbi:MAG: hypothetical protein WD120_02070 [Gemmatimonadota bacterium]
MLVLLGTLLGVQPRPISAQEGATLGRSALGSVDIQVDTLTDTAREEDGEITPGGAFLRSLVLPGWGHVIAGAPARGAFYFTAQAGAAWMLGKSIQGRREAQRFRDEEARIVRARHEAAGVSSLDSLAAFVRADGEVAAWDSLIDSRAQQVEDWIALGIFVMLLSATDAFVAGHLMDRPEPLTLDVAPHPEGGWQFSVSLNPPGLR